MATKSKGVGRGGARPGAGRKPKPSLSPQELDAANTQFADKSVEELMEIAVRAAAFKGRWDEVSRAGARLLNARARQAASEPGKGAQRQAAAEAATGPASRFAPPAPPKVN